MLLDSGLCVFRPVRVMINTVTDFHWHTFTSCLWLKEEEETLQAYPMFITSASWIILTGLADVKPDTINHVSLPFHQWVLSLKRLLKLGRSLVWIRLHKQINQSNKFWMMTGKVLCIDNMAACNVRDEISTKPTHSCSSFSPTERAKFHRYHHCK